MGRSDGKWRLLRPLLEIPVFLLVSAALALPFAAVLGFDGAAVDAGLAISTTASALLVARVFEKKTAREVGFDTASVSHHLLLGLAVGTAIATVFFGLLWISDWYTAQAGDPPIEAMTIGLFLVGMSAWWQEIVFRGVLLRVLLPYGVTVSLLISSSLFGLAHLFNEGTTLVEAARPALSGIWFGCAFIATQKIWLPFAIHWGVNFSYISIFGIPLEERNFPRLLAGTVSGPESWVGTRGDDGMIAFILELALSVVAIALLIRSRRNRRGTTKTDGRSQIESFSPSHSD